jgi:hypothetical protein
MELVDTIRNPQKYAIFGARAPTGILLEGPSGTGACVCLACACVLCRWLMRDVLPTATMYCRSTRSRCMY